MAPSLLIGLVLVVLGVADVALARFLIGPRIADPAQRTRLVRAVNLGGLLLVLLGLAFLLGLVPT